MRIKLFFFFSFTALSSIAQQQFLSLNRQQGLLYEQRLNTLNSNSFTSFKPYLVSQLPTDVNEDSVYSFLPEYHSPEKNILKKAGFNLLHDHFITIDKDILHLTIDPLMDFEAGQDFTWDKGTYVNTRGVTASGDIGEKFSFSSSFYESQGKFPRYLNQFILDTLVVPGQGHIKRAGTRIEYDYSMATGYISYSPSKYFNFQLGHDKNFIGDGYRSLLLSDNSSPYPFLKVTTRIWKLQYVNLWNEMLDIRERAILGEGYRKKYGAFHYLSMQFGRRLEIGLFESVIWQQKDSSVYRGFDVNYLNPVIFYHSVQGNLGSPDNSAFGLNVKEKITNTLSLYGQFFLDDLDLAKAKKGQGYFLTKFAFQAGAKWFDAFGIKNLYLQTEYNHVRPYVYSHKIPVLNYAHYNQSLADPLGANFHEWISFVNYRWKRFSFSAEILYALIGLDANQSYNEGHNIYRSDYDIPGAFVNGKVIGTYGNFTGQGLQTDLLYGELKFDYLINPKNNLNFELSVVHRQQENELKKSMTNFITFGLKTNLINRYYDF